MLCLGLEPGAGWSAQTNPLNYGGTPPSGESYKPSATIGIIFKQAIF